VAGVAGSEVGSDLGIALLPEGGQVAGDRDRAACGRQEVQYDRDTTVRDGWGGGPAEDLLQLDGEDRRLGTVVRESYLGARWNLEAFGCEIAELRCCGPWQESPEGRGHLDAGKVWRASYRGKFRA
jgi:hypothetical protein